MPETLKTKASETGVCCCVDVGTILDNNDTTASLDMPLATEAEAKAKLESLTAKAREVQTEPCQIESEIVEAEGLWHLKAKFGFCCEAEKLIFELALR